MKRHFKLWHDHSSVDGHSYLLVLITPIYDPVFHLTPEEMEQKTGVYMDVQGIVEQPEVHIVGRSSSSIAEQTMSSMCCQECLKEIGEAVHTSFGIAVNNTVRFFHGDGPTQQFEVGHKQGGTYSCVGCGAITARFNDFSYCHYSEKRTYRECQECVTSGVAWKRRGKPMHSWKSCSHTGYTHV